MKNLVLLIAEELGNKKFFFPNDVQEIMRDNMVATGTASDKIWEIKENEYKFDELSDKAEKGEISEDILNKDVISKRDLIEFAKIILESIAKDSGV